MKRTSTFLIGIFVLAAAMLAGHAAAQECVEPPPGLVSWWPGDGNADDIQNGNDGTLMDGAGFPRAWWARRSASTEWTIAW